MINMVKLEDNVELLNIFIEKELFKLAEVLCKKHFTLNKVVELKKNGNCVNTQKITQKIINDFGRLVMTPKYN